MQPKPKRTLENRTSTQFAGKPETRRERATAQIRRKEGGGKGRKGRASEAGWLAGWLLCLVAQQVELELGACTSILTWDAGEPRDPEPDKASTNRWLSVICPVELVLYVLRGRKASLFKRGDGWKQKFSALVQSEKQEVQQMGSKAPEGHLQWPVGPIDGASIVTRSRLVFSIVTRFMLIVHRV